MIKRIVLGSCLMAAASLVSAADGHLNRTVGYSELDLTSPAGVEILYRRLGNAAEYVCSPLEGRSAKHVHAYDECIDSAITGAVAKVNQPLLTRHHQLRTGEGSARLASR